MSGNFGVFFIMYQVLLTQAWPQKSLTLVSEVIPVAPLQHPSPRGALVSLSCSHAPPLLITSPVHLENSPSVSAARLPSGGTGLSTWATH